MKKTINNSILKVAWRAFANAMKFHYAGLATWTIFLVILLLSLLGSIRYNGDTQTFVPGETATNDVYASRTLRIEDSQATHLRREQNIALQPTLFDLDRKSIQNFRDEILSLLTTVSSFSLENSLNRTINKSTQESFNERYKVRLEADFFSVLSHPEVQDYLTSTLIPFSESILTNGIFPDRKQLIDVRGTILIRDAALGTELLIIPGKNPYPDLESFYLSIRHELRHSNLSPRERDTVLELVRIVAKPSLVLNKEESILRATEIASTIPPVYYYIQKGERIVSKGTVVTREQQLKMQALYQYTSHGIDFERAIGVFVLASCFAIGFFISPISQIGTKLYSRSQYFIAFLLVLFGLLALLLRLALDPIIHQFESYFYLFPVAAGGGLAALTFSARRYLCIGILISLFSTVLLNGTLELFCFFFLSSMLNTYLIFKAQSRQDVIQSTIILLIGNYLIGSAAAVYALTALSQYPILFLALTINTVLSLFLIFAVSPLAEMFFRLTTRFRLMELMNLEQPLLQELMLNAPGTYHHAVIVSNFAEAAATAVNANSLLCKVSALYHDIGKLTRPEYFVENQINIPNKHDQLAPAMSALIIISHVKQGMELAEKYGLGREITDIINEHHGNRCMKYFYDKALKSHTGEGEAPKEADYSYANCRPRTKEAAIIMLADAVEASARTLNDPTPARIQSHVNKIVRGIYEEGQLDDSDLTFRDLTLISEAFVRSVNGLFHQRIAYPEKDKVKDK